MTRAELEQVRAALERLLYGPTIKEAEAFAWETVVAAAESSLALLDSALAKPEAKDLEWGIQFNDGDPVDSTVYPMLQSEAIKTAATDKRRKVFTRTRPYQVPAGPWERAK